MLVNNRPNLDHLPNELSFTSRRLDQRGHSSRGGPSQLRAVISQEEALATILRSVRCRSSRALPLTQANGYFAAEDVLATVSVPAFDNSAMDGYAVVASSCAPGRRLRLVGEQPAGLDRGLAVRPGEAVRILTGAPMPMGADAVVMQEDTTVGGDEVIVNSDVVAGESVRRHGGDVAAGQKILSAGERIGAGTVALLASQGLTSVKVGGEVRASIVSTGDELAPAGAQLQPGQIYDSNSPLLEALLRRCGTTSISREHCPDDPGSTEAAVRRGLQADVLIISGGVSVGSRDYVKSALSAAGAQIDVWRVSVKPGKPFLFGRAGDCAIFGLPGNPVSAFMTFLLFVRPAILKLMGAGEEALPLRSFPVRNAREIANPGDRPHYVRGEVKDGSFTPVGAQESHAIFGLSRSNALLLVPARSTVSAGETSNVFVWD